MNEHSTKEEKLEKAVDAMEHAAELSEEQWQEVLEDKDILQACKDILHTSYVLTMDKKNQAVPLDTEKELQKFKLRKEQEKKTIQQKKVRQIWLSLTSLAAAILLCLGSYYYLTHTVPQPQQIHKEGVWVFQADNHPQEVLLDKGNGETTVLHTHEANLTKASTKQTLSYQSQLTQPVKAETLPPHKLTIPRGETFRLTLSDGTEVWLNANSYFVYPTAFVGKERVVSLEGEAYFKVAKDNARPFIVKTPNVQTRVLGTEFNLRSYTPEDTHVVLIKGKVEVSNAHSNAFTPLEPGEDAHLQPDGNFHLTQVDLDSYTYWKDGYFYFDNSSLKEIMENIGRWYNVNIQFRNPEAMNYKLHFVAHRDKPLEHTLKLLNRMKKVTAVIHDNTVTIH